MLSTPPQTRPRTIFRAALPNFDFVFMIFLLHFFLKTPAAPRSDNGPSLFKKEGQLNKKHLSTGKSRPV